MSTMITLSVIRTFISEPSRDFTVKIQPSRASKPPRMRTDGGCCADVAEASSDTAVSDAATRGGIDQMICDRLNCGMACPLQKKPNGRSATNQQQTPQPRCYSGRRIH